MKLSKPPPSLNVRIHPATMTSYLSLVEGAGETSAAITRQLIEQLCSAANKLDMSDFAVQVKFQRHDVAWGSWNAEFVGTISAQVRVPKSVEPLLARTVFVLPEFWEEDEPNARLVEPFRIDNANFLRITANRVAVTSSKVTRNVLSFRLLEGRWDGSLYFYGGLLSRDEVEARVTEALTQHFRATIQLQLLGHLPLSRVLTDTELAEVSALDAERVASRR